MKFLKETKSVHQTNLMHTYNGSDGHRPPSGCIFYVPRNRAYHIVIRELIGNQA